MKRSNLTPSQTAEVLHIAPSTLRLWSQLFADSLSADAHSDGRKHRSYSPDDINLLYRAGELLKTHKPDEVKALLSLGDDVQRGAALATLPTIAGEMAALRSLVMQLRADVAALEAARQADRAELETMRASFQQFAARQVKRSKHQQAELDDVRAQLADLQARRHWWQRIRQS